jgi:SAM-dependent methyltransferase
MTAITGSVGYAPTVTIRPIERELYKQMWDREEYRRVSPGEECANDFLAMVKPKHGSSMLDLGCGTGRGGLSLAFFGGMDVTLVDFADNCLDTDVRDMLKTQSHALRFVQADLTKPLPVEAAYGYCCDVLEHIPAAQIDDVLDNCLRACQHVFFQISTVDDALGVLVGHKLHLSVHPYEWWLQKLQDRGCTVHWSQGGSNSCAFYVTAWMDGQKVVDSGVLNVDERQVIENVRHNIAQGWDQVQPHLTNDVEVVILGGGPSLNGCEEEIRQKQAEGAKIVTLNGAYNWCLDRGIAPVNQIVVDARAFNSRFTRPAREDCFYFIASQCDPSVLEGLPKNRTLLWHTTAEMIRPLLDEQYGGKWWGIPGGSTVLLRAIPLLRMLGFQKFHLYGCDSCLTAEEHHAYKQDENAADVVVPVVVGGRVFHCHPWMASQAQELMSLVKYMGDEIALDIHGDGLLAWLLQHAAQLDEESTVTEGVC